MTTEKEHKVVQLSESERRELKEASREIAANLNKMKEIMTRKLDLPAQNQGEFRGKIVDIEIPWVEVRYPDGSVYCYQDPPGSCCARPCPCS
jgi:hypothetical protein